jgi:uncharacterized UBP type Zn finger protein
MSIEETEIDPIYNLIANIVHVGSATSGYYKVHIRNKAGNGWMEM